MFEKTNISSVLLKTKFKYHKEIKNKLISLIDKEKAENIKVKDNYFDDNITFTDWSTSSNFELPWKKYFLNYFVEVLKEMANVLGFNKIKLMHLWFQKYEKDGYHNWHIHGYNYTGVYYLNLPKGSSDTKLLDCYDLKSVQSSNAEEGDIIFFPSSVIHKGSKQIKDETKIIISWNIELDSIKKEIIDYLKYVE
jgi:hypothetical protein